jgi:hypothetical protein
MCPVAAVSMCRVAAHAARATTFGAAVGCRLPVCARLAAAARPHTAAAESSSAFSTSAVLHTNGEPLSAAWAKRAPTELPTGVVAAVEVALYRLSCAHDPAHPKWVPLGAITSALPDRFMPELERFSSGGVREIVGKHLTDRCQLSFDAESKTWRASIVPFDPLLPPLHAEVVALLQERQRDGGNVFPLEPTVVRSRLVATLGAAFVRELEARHGNITRALVRVWRRMPGARFLVESRRTRNHVDIFLVRDEWGQTVAPVGDARIDVRHLIAFVPTFFIPVEAVVEQLAPRGYTREHVTQLIASSEALQLVTVPLTSRAFIRMHGGRSKFPFAPILDTNARFAHFEPRPAAAAPFARALLARFSGVRGQWMPLRELLELAGPEAEAALPFKGPEALLYFAQLQHWFAFAVSTAPGGMVCLRDTATAPLRLLDHSSPCAFAFQQLCRLLSQTKRASVERCAAAVGLARMPELARLMLLAAEHSDGALPALSAPSRADVAGARTALHDVFAHFCAAHPRRFAWDDAAGEVVWAMAAATERRRALPLEEQLAIARAERAPYHRMRSVCSALARQRDPHNALWDNDALALALHAALPADRHVTMEELVNSVPHDYVYAFMPSVGPLGFCLRFPQLFCVFDLQTNRVVAATGRRRRERCVMRAGLPIPDGAVPQDLTADDLLAFVVDELQRAGGRMPLLPLYAKLPLTEFMRGQRVRSRPQFVRLLQDHADMFVLIGNGEHTEEVVLAAGAAARLAACARRTSGDDDDAVSADAGDAAGDEDDDDDDPSEDRGDGQRLT